MSEVEHEEDVTLNTDEALKLMPLLNKSALIKLRRDGKGPKFGQFANAVIYRKVDVLAWYTAFKEKAFSQTRVAATTRPAKAKASVPAKAPAAKTVRTTAADKALLG